MTEQEFEIFHLTTFRNLASAIAELMVQDPDSYLGGMATREQQIQYYHDCLEASEKYDQKLLEIGKD